MIYRIVTALTFLTAAPAFAQGAWDHAYTPGFGGQWEGRFEAPDGSYSAQYGCVIGGNSVSFFATGPHVGPGKSSLSVDGKVVFEGNTGYSSESNSTYMEISADASMGAETKQAFNAVVMALAGGSQAVWTTPDETAFSISLANSKDIVDGCILS
ncbi:hypothetical protein ACOI1H_14890 [Loktanella sp. DJP18]|uniref:hypothetical protein n=1 Tax=Loktanella sp. DJP18 TaxID=3409788 RepID=UPI003BB51C00